MFTVLLPPGVNTIAVNEIYQHIKWTKANTKHVITVTLVRTASLWAITQWAEVIPYRQFGTTHWVPSWPENMGPMGCPDRSVRNYHCLLRDSPEERSHQKRAAVYSVYIVTHIFISYNVRSAVTQLSYWGCSELHHPTARTVMAQFYSSTSEFTVGIPELDSDKHKNIPTVRLIFNISTRFMKNQLCQQKKIKLCNKWHFVEYKTEIKHHSLEDTNDMHRLYHSLILRTDFYMFWQ
jgi:hypothetical protein